MPKPTKQEIADARRAGESIRFFLNGGNDSHMTTPAHEDGARLALAKLSLLLYRDAAEARAEANAKDAERYRKYLEIYDTEELTAAEWNGSNAITDHIDAIIAEGKK